MADGLFNTVPTDRLSIVKSPSIETESSFDDGTSDMSSNAEIEKTSQNRTKSNYVI